MRMKQQTLLFKIFGNKERVQLIRCLKKRQSVSELLLKCTLSQSALSQHLRLLKQAGLVECTRKGKLQIYSLKEKKALSLAEALLTFTSRSI